ncbi:MAG TPA: hypothetical protein VF842_05730, partial [Flavobacterium sp.]
GETADVGLIVENSDQPDTAALTLPIYYPNSEESHFIDIFLKKDTTIPWELQNLPDWVTASTTKGILKKDADNERIQISVDWRKWNKNQVQKAQFTINYENKTKVVNLTIDSNSIAVAKKSFIAMADKVVIYAQNFTSVQNKNPYRWKKIDVLG